MIYTCTGHARHSMLHTRDRPQVVTRKHWWLAKSMVCTPLSSWFASMVLFLVVGIEALNPIVVDRRTSTTNLVVQTTPPPVVSAYNATWTVPSPAYYHTRGLICPPGMFVAPLYPYVYDPDVTYQAVPNPEVNNPLRITCLDCPLGAICLGGTSTVPFSCINSFSNTSSATVCSICPNNTWAPSSSPMYEYRQSHDSSNCPIPNNKWGESCRTQTGYIKCNPCPAETHKPDSAAIVCTPCSAGIECPVYDSQCPPGSYVYGVYCGKCTAGMFSTVQGASRCMTTPAGTYTSVGATASIDCAPGTYQSSAGMTSCNYCNTGTYSATPRATACTQCPAGKFGAHEGFYDSNLCQMCPLGKYQASAGQSACLQCSLGRSTTTTGSIHQSNCTCPRTSYIFSGSCLQCPNGGFTPTTNFNGTERDCACDASVGSHELDGVCQTCANLICAEGQRYDNPNDCSRGLDGCVDCAICQPG